MCVPSLHLKTNFLVIKEEKNYTSLSHLLMQHSFRIAALLFWFQRRRAIGALLLCMWHVSSVALAWGEAKYLRKSTALREDKSTCPATMVLDNNSCQAGVLGEGVLGGACSSKGLPFSVGRWRCRVPPGSAAPQEVFFSFQVHVLSICIHCSGQHVVNTFAPADVHPSHHSRLPDYQGSPSLSSPS